MTAAGTALSPASSLAQWAATVSPSWSWQLQSSTTAAAQQGVQRTRRAVRLGRPHAAAAQGRRPRAGGQREMPRNTQAGAPRPQGSPAAGPLSGVACLQSWRPPLAARWAAAGCPGCSSAPGCSARPASSGGNRNRFGRVGAGRSSQAERALCCWWCACGRVLWRRRSSVAGRKAARWSVRRPRQAGRRQLAPQPGGFPTNNPIEGPQCQATDERWVPPRSPAAQAAAREARGRLALESRWAMPTTSPRMDAASLTPEATARACRNCSRGQQAATQRASPDPAGRWHTRRAACREMHLGPSPPQRPTLSRSNSWPSCVGSMWGPRLARME